MTESIPATDEQAIREVVAQADRAQSDPGTLIPLHTADAIVVNLAGRRVLGRDVLQAAMTDAMSSALRDVRTSVEIVDVRLPGPDVALVSCLKTVHDERPDADRSALPMIGALTYVLVRKGDGWRIALAQTTPVVA
jgi:uncharacterized protein (TIGR02246 family)